MVTIKFCWKKSTPSWPMGVLSLHPQKSLVTGSWLTHDWLLTGFRFIFYAPNHTNNNPLWWINYYKHCFMSFMLMLACLQHVGAPLQSYASKGWPNFETLGYEWAQVILLCDGWGCKRLQTASHILIGYIKCFSTLVCCEWAYGSTPTLLQLCRLGVAVKDLGQGWAQVMLLCYGWGSKPP